MRICNTCTQEHEGLTARCASCIAIGKKRWYAENPAYSRQKQLARYGITIEEFDEMAAGQGGVCAICKQPPTGRVLHVDHDHITGKVRGLLCGPHNRALGLFGDDINLLMEAASYLKNAL